MTEPTYSPGDENVERLIARAYRPEAIDPLFEAETLIRLEREAELRRASQPRRVAWGRLAAAAGVLGLIVLPALLLRLGRAPDVKTHADQTARFDRVIPRPRPASIALFALKPGETVATAAGQKKRVRLGDDSTVSLNEKTRARLDSDRKLTLLEGEAFVEVAPGNELPFVVSAPGRLITALGTKLAVRVGALGSTVLVTQGQVSVEGVGQPVEAGHFVEAGSDRVRPAPRVSHALAWASDFVRAESLVPASDFQGGALVVNNPDGQTTRLSLRRYRVDVHIEDGFARTTIDQTYFNHEVRRVEGTFHFPLPADASLSRLAMYVDGTRNEGGMVERDYGRAVYKSIVDKMQDPALLEWVDGTTFKMRVFPLEARQEKRIILSYTQKLPVLYGKTTYRFPAGHSLGEVGEWELSMRVKDGQHLGWYCPSHAVVGDRAGEDIVLRASAKKSKLDRDVVLELTDRAAVPPAEARFAETEHDGFRYLGIRYRPDLNGKRRPQTRRDWVFLVETSSDRDPLLARAQVEIVRAMLDNAGQDDTFAVVALNNRARVIVKPQSASKEKLAAALAPLDQTHLIGALDLARGLDEAAKLLKEAKHPHLVHVGSGLPGLGERRVEELLKAIPKGTRYVGVGVGKRWNRALMKQGAEQTGGYFTQINPDEALYWRAFDLLATLNTPRLLDVKLADPDGRLSFMSTSTLLAEGEELFAVTRVADTQKTWPAAVVVTGTLEGKPFRRTLPVVGVTPKAGYLSRTWGRLEIDRLVADGAKKNKDAIVTLSKKLYVMSPFTSLLVLENEAMYQQFKVDRGRKDHWAMYDCPDRIDVYYEPFLGEKQVVRGEKAVKPGNKRSADEVRRTLFPSNPSRLGERDWTRLQILAFSPDGRRLAIETRSKSQVRVWNQLEGMEFTRRSPVQDQWYFSRSGPNRNLWLDQKIANEGIDPETPAGFDVNRFVEVNVPGPVDPLAASDITGQPEGTPIDFLPPPGMGRGTRFMTHDSAELFSKLFSNTPQDGIQLKYRPAGLESQLSEKQLRQQVDGEFGSWGLGSRTGLFGEPLARLAFHSLTLHAPGLHTTAADIQAVLEAEADLTKPVTRGEIDSKARALLDRARKSRWYRLTVPASKSMPAYDIFADTTGSYRYERVLPSGLREIVVCDGETLLHLYPEIGLAGRRTVSRFHRAEFFARVPWALPPVEDLAMGANVLLDDARTVAVVSHLKQNVLHLVFDADGQLVERKVMDAAGKRVLSVQKCGERKPTEAPELKPDLKSLVVLPMPVRTTAEVHRANPGLASKPVADLAEAEAMKLLSASSVDRPDLALSLLKVRFFGKGDHRTGLFVLLYAMGHSITDAPEAGKSISGKLGKYLARFNPEKPKDEIGTASTNRPASMDFFGRMDALADLLEATGGRRRFDTSREDEMLEAVRGCHSPLILTHLLDVIVARLNAPDGSKGNARLACKALEEIGNALADYPGLAYVARYEHARALYKGVDVKAGRTLFIRLLRDTLAAGRVPAFDQDIRNALGDSWATTIHEAAAKCDAPTLFQLAGQCLGVNEEQPGLDLVKQALALDLPAQEKASLALSAVALVKVHLGESKALALLSGLLKAQYLKDDPDAWRAAASLSQHQGGLARTLTYLEKGLDLEWARPSARLDLRRLRADYTNLLAGYDRLAEAATDLGQSRPADLTLKTLRAVERWRILDPQGPAAEQGFQTLLALGERERAWDYLTTFASSGEPTAQQWRERAATQSRQLGTTLVARCLKEAAALEAAGK